MGLTNFRALLVDFCSGLDTGLPCVHEHDTAPEAASVPAVPTTLSQSQSQSQSQSHSVNDNFAARGEAAWKHFLAIGKARAAEHVFADIQDAIDAGWLVTRGLVAQGSGGSAA